MILFIISSACSLGKSGGQGGADTMLYLHMPFESGYSSICTQGTGGSWSHRHNSTRFSVDFNTPNNRDDIVVAPISGTAYTHDNPHDGFGRHVNIDLGDGTFIVMAHMKSIIVSNGEEVGYGQVLGYEGSTGNSTGDHVHFGRQLGSAEQPAGQSQSINTVNLMHRHSTNPDAWYSVTINNLVCNSGPNANYMAATPPIRSHPDGTLIKSIDSVDVFLVNDGRRHRFRQEQDFWSHNFDFQDLVIVAPDELDCYPVGHEMSTTAIRAAYDGRLWLLIGEQGSGNSTRHRVPDQAWREILLSWGIHLDSPSSASEHASIIDSYPDSGYYANFRDGTLVKEVSRSDVYLVSNGVGQSIFNWDVLRRFGLAKKNIITVDDGVLGSVLLATGNCQTSNFCLTHDFAEHCGRQAHMIPNLPPRRAPWGDPSFGASGDQESSAEDSGSTTDQAEFDTGDIAETPPTSPDPALPIPDPDLEPEPTPEPVPNPPAPTPEPSPDPEPDPNPPTTPSPSDYEVEICWSRQSSNSDRHLQNTSNGSFWFAGYNASTTGNFNHLCICTQLPAGTVVMGNASYSSTDHRLTSTGRPRTPPGWATWWAFTLNNGVEMQVGEIHADFNCDNQPSGNPLSIELIPNGNNGRDGRWVIPSP